MKTERQLAGYEALLALPEKVRAEVLAGEVVTHPSPLPEHQYIANALGATVHGRFGDPNVRDGWWIIPDMDVRLAPHDIVRPDLSGWRRARLPSPWGKRPIDVVPDWACEILSPSHVSHDIVKKKRLYATAGIRHYWILDPASRTLTALELHESHWVELGAWDDAATVRIAPFEELEIDTSRLFPPKSEAVHER